MLISTSKGVGTLYYQGKPLMELQSIEPVTISKDSDRSSHLSSVGWFKPVEMSFSVQATPETVKAFNRILHEHQYLPRMTRKRFIKLLMGRGLSRNAARNAATTYHKIGFSWAEAWNAHYRLEGACP